MSSRFAYDLDYDPPVPICTVMVTSTASRAIQLQALIDTGADATVVRSDICAKSVHNLHLKLACAATRVSVRPVSLYLFT